MIGRNNDTRAHDQKPQLKKAIFYLKATMKCPNCSHQEDVLINLDKEVYHECNEGNVRAIVPTLELPTIDLPVKRLALKKGK